MNWGGGEGYGDGMEWDGGKWRDRMEMETGMLYCRMGGWMDLKISNLGQAMNSTDRVLYCPEKADSCDLFKKGNVYVCMSNDRQLIENYSHRTICRQGSGD